MSALVEKLSLKVVKFLGFSSCNQTGKHISLFTTKTTYSEFQLIKSYLKAITNLKYKAVILKTTVYAQEHRRQNPHQPPFKPMIQRPTLQACL